MRLHITKLLRWIKSAEGARGKGSEYRTPQSVDRLAKENGY